jgi:hypothetical protein
MVAAIAQSLINFFLSSGLASLQSNVHTLVLNHAINLTRGKVIKRDLGLSLLNRSITIVTILNLNT